MPLGLDMWPLVLLLLCCSGYWCHDCNMTRLYFESRNFHSMLYWDEVDIPGQNVLYSIEYKQYGELWHPMVECQNISATSCDFSSVITDIYMEYYARIMINSMCFETYKPFIPIQLTTLGAPKVSVSTAESSFTVMVTTPMGPQNKSVKEISRDSSGQLHVNYEVRLTHPASKAQQKGTRNTSGVITLSNLEVNTEYCGTAFYLWTHPSSLKQSESTTFCVTVPAKPWMHMFIVPGLIALFLLITLALVLCQLYVTRKSHLPQVLIMPKSNNPPCYSDPKVKLDDVRICSESPWKFDKPEPGLCPVMEESKDVNDGGSYAAQDCHGLPWRCNSYTNQQVVPVENCSQSNDSAISYSMVLTSMVPKESPNSANESSKLPGTTSCAGGGSDLQNERPAQGWDEKHPDSNSEPLVLPVSRVANGKLEFSQLTFLPELQSPSGLLANTSEITPLITGLTSAGERTPLLTDLITMDKTEWSNGGLASDYGRAYFPNYVQQNCPVVPSTDAIPLVSLSDCTSSYRQNWVPGIPLESQFSNSETEQLTESEEEEEEKESLSRLGPIFVDGLVVQIQG
ncbi:interferon lambda receptor 1 [Pygocentrus nattereri]|uniref:Fibronectin type-III domain-containing protein n=1 Tax=Pygocentrus nattereri TaxID=42514 RepID=A0A3B4DMZ9_PYGNA|nr:interferon lambda receptor 1 [Pygocentrus nattereri]